MASPESDIGGANTRSQKFSEVNLFNLVYFGTPTQKEVQQDFDIIDSIDKYTQLEPVQRILSQERLAAVMKLQRVIRSKLNKKKQEDFFAPSNTTNGAIPHTADVHLVVDKFQEMNEQWTKSVELLDAEQFKAARSKVNALMSRMLCDILKYYVQGISDDQWGVLTKDLLDCKSKLHQIREKRETLLQELQLREEEEKLVMQRQSARVEQLKQQLTRIDREKTELLAQIERGEVSELLAMELQDELAYPDSRRPGAAPSETDSRKKKRVVSWAQVESDAVQTHSPKRIQPARPCLKKRAEDKENRGHNNSGARSQLRPPSLNHQFFKAIPHKPVL
jgi:hypothetical protein